MGSLAPSVLKGLIDIVFPPVCPLCEEDVAEGPLCKKCLGGFGERAITHPICTVCGEPFPSSAAGDHPCSLCLEKAPPFKTARSLFVYEGPVLDAVHRLKYNGRVTLARALGELVLERYPFDEKPDTVVPVPMHPSRLKVRGYNQSLLIAKFLAKGLRVGLDRTALRKTLPTAPQVNLKAEERRKNVSGSFDVRDPRAFMGKRVLLVDDVYTTGATAAECSKVSRKAGAEVYVLTVARALKV